MKTLKTIITAPLVALIALGFGLWELWLPLRGWLRRIKTGIFK